MMSLANKYLSNYQFHEKHQIIIEASIQEVQDTIDSYDSIDDSFFRIMILLREIPMRFLNRLGIYKNVPVAHFNMHNFIKLEHNSNEQIYGLIGKFWKLNYGQFIIKENSDFLDFKKPHYAKLLLIFNVKKVNEKEVLLTTETRIHCLDTYALKRFRIYWYLIRPISGLIRMKILRSIKNQISINNHNKK
ncbi:hypothetical protein [Acinetobacter pollinis]|uniref:DUF2867 domain-containing protein n=1 Tax=Acinetobacter pollinis TaxID=2605270 RepID=A0ABU6DTT0_9GAMM|nr:hypothetical protein [Acinetobacter pollinis]MEB5476856.1 hypothetical protein [Acinetobacter pollinis]